MVSISFSSTSAGSLILSVIVVRVIASKRRYAGALYKCLKCECRCRSS